jgi:hypothetical protein
MVSPCCLCVSVSPRLKAGTVELVETTVSIQRLDKHYSRGKGTAGRCFL